MNFTKKLFSSAFKENLLSFHFFINLPNLVSSLINIRRKLIEPLEEVNTHVCFMHFFMT